GNDNNGNPIYQENFQTIFQNLISWASGLFSLQDQSYANGLAGLMPMNEPAHLLGNPQARCNSTTNWGITSYQPVLDTLALAVQDFKHSSLPSHHVYLYMNIIETMFPVTMSDSQIYQIIGSWWNKITSSADQQQWAILDIHHYIAWDSSCNSCLTNYVKNN